MVIYFKEDAYMKLNYISKICVNEEITYSITNIIELRTVKLCAIFFTN